MLIVGGGGESSLWIASGRVSPVFCWPVEVDESSSNRTNLHAHKIRLPEQLGSDRDVSEPPYCLRPEDIVGSDSPHSVQRSSFHTSVAQLFFPVY